MGKLLHISIDSVSGDHYGFAAVDEEALELVLRTAGRDPQNSLLTIENIQHAWLMMPWSVVRSVSARPDGEETWQLVWRRGEGCLYTGATHRKTLKLGRH